MYDDAEGEGEGTLVLRIAGMIKVGESVREFESSLERATTEHMGSVVLDLSDLEYIDSTTMGVLVGALHRLKAENRDLVLVNPRERIASLLRVAKLDSLFEIYDTVPEAIAAIRRREDDTGGV
jgi:anti-sigma B factor antagonist